MTTSALPRDNPAWYTPAGLPEELAALDRPVEGSLKVGAPGKVGLLELSLERSCSTTRVAHQYQQAPLHVYRPIYLDEHLPGMAFVFVQQFGDGYVHGDRCRIDVDCGPGAEVHMTTQAATNIYRAHRNFATQLVNLRTAPGAVLEYLPDAVVPFGGSRFFQRTRLTIDPDSTAMLGDLLLPGRVARNELHAYDLYWAETGAHRPDGTLLFADAIRFCPADGLDPRSHALLGGHDVLATLYVITQRKLSDEIVEVMRKASGGRDVLVGVSELPNRSGASARFLGPTSKAVRAALTNTWNAARIAILGAPLPDLRKG